MKWIICFLSMTFSVSSLAGAWLKSPELEALVEKLNAKYTSGSLHEIDIDYMNQVDNLSYFIRYIDQPHTPEHGKLKAYLLGAQQAHVGSINRQIQTNVIPWFCPPSGGLKSTGMYAKNQTEFIENIIWQALERDLVMKPDRFDRYNGAAAFADLSGFIQYGLQTKYPCYEQVPESHRLTGFNY